MRQCGTTCFYIYCTINTSQLLASFESIFLVDPKNLSTHICVPTSFFCEFFTNIGPNLAMIPSSTSSFRSFLSGSFIKSIFLEPTNELEISEICASFRAGTSAGFDQVTMDVVKQTIDLIIGPLTHIMNLSLSSGIVPEQMKVCSQGVSFPLPSFQSGSKNVNKREYLGIGAFHIQLRVQMNVLKHLKSMENTTLI